MKYQVLARKYRPKTFSTMMGQEHVLKALSNALNNERLHHAYLFTGTRGVGKTTVARVLAKALNCEQGITASPCGECAACREIDEGRFVDLIEVDAASRTKVEDTRELLDNVQYAPTRGRFKIYLIDEVHMLSTHSFNALLKTLEEPPPHVKFLLATTDPQKLPVTILSRCLQFNLKSLTIEQIEKQLELILNAEQIPFEHNVLKPLAIAADGSMRDALSLLDQSIAYSNGTPNLADIEAMLGTVQKDRVFELLTALANEDGKMLIGQSRILTGQGIDVNTILSELISTMQRIALSQMVPEAIDDSLGDKNSIERMAGHISPEDIQLYYQIALNGRKDLPYSPQPQGGFEMILLRMLAFKPAGGGNRLNSKQSTKISPEQSPKESAKTTQNSLPDKLAEKKTSEIRAVVAVSIAENKHDGYKADVTKAETQAETQADENRAKTIPDSSRQAANLNQRTNTHDDLPPIEAYGLEHFAESSDIPSFDSETPLIGDIQKNMSPDIKQNSTQNYQLQTSNMSNSSVTAKTETMVNEKPPVPSKSQPPLAEVVPLFKAKAEGEQAAVEKQVPCNDQDGNELSDYWHDLINRSELNGLEQQLAKHSALVTKSEKNGEYFFELLLDSVHKHLHNDKIKNRLVSELQGLFGCTVKLDIKECQVSPKKLLDTPRRREIHDAKILQEQAVESIYADTKVQMIVNSFAAKIRNESIKPI